MSTHFVTVNGKEFIVQLGTDGTLRLNNDEVVADVRQQSARAFSYLTENTSKRVVVERMGEAYHMLVDGIFVEAIVESERSRLLKKFNTKSNAVHRRTEIHAPMPALVVRVEVEVGQEVTMGQGLIILEAMKMENEIKAITTGRVKEILVTKGKAVEKGERLIILE